MLILLILLILVLFFLFLIFILLLLVRIPNRPPPPTPLVKGGRKLHRRTVRAEVVASSTSSLRILKLFAANDCCKRADVSGPKARTGCCTKFWNSCSAKAACTSSLPAR